jgi:Tol biopolymer transport system component
MYAGRPLTTYPGSEITPSFSPDGDRVAFSWDGESQDNFDIYIKQIDVETPIRLTTDPRPDLSPAWSPDGRSIAFVRMTPNGRAEVLLTSSFVGGSEQKIADISTSVPLPTYLRARLISWSPDGKWLVVPDGQSSQSPIGLMLLNVASGEKRKLTRPMHDTDLDPALSPDMTRLAFTRYSTVSSSDLYLLELSRDLTPHGEPVRLEFRHRLAVSPVWAPAGRAILFARRPTAGSPALWQMRLAGGRHTEPLPVTTDNAEALVASSKGNRLIYTRLVENDTIWGIEALGSRISLSQEKTTRPWITSTSQEITPQFSPDGQLIAFQSGRSGYGEIWISNRDGSHRHQLTRLKGQIAGFPDWSPDGKKIVFHSRQPSEAMLYVVDVDGGRTRHLDTGPDGEAYTPCWSRDGKWIYFSSRRSGEDEIWKVAAEGGSPVRITSGGGWIPSESVDGKTLFYGGGAYDGIVRRIPTSGGEEEQVLSDVAGSGAAFTVTGTGIYFIKLTKGEAKQKLAFFDFATERITLLADIPQPAVLNITISADERILLYSRREQYGSDLMLVENFR